MSKQEMEFRHSDTLCKGLVITADAPNDSTTASTKNTTTRDIESLVFLSICAIISSLNKSKRDGLFHLSYRGYAINNSQFMSGSITNGATLRKYRFPAVKDKETVELMAERLPYF